LSASTKLLTVKVVENRNLFPNLAFLHIKNFDFEKMFYYEVGSGSEFIPMLFGSGAGSGSERT